MKTIMKTCIYTIDNENRIINVSGNWLSFALENQAAESCHPDRVINEPIWKFIAGNETRYLYELCIAKVRSQQQTMILPFRCDAPDRRRYLELKMTPLAQEQIEFASRIIREEPRENVKLLQIDVSRSDALIKMCSMCKKVKMSESVWIEVEDAIHVLRLFEEDFLPKITHGCCLPCYEIAMDEIRKLKGGTSAP
jgi:hypothetical protein